MKKKLTFCFIIFLLLSGFINANAFSHLTTKNTVAYNVSKMVSPAQNTIQYKLFRLKLIIDSLNYDDIVIGFGPNTSTKYNPQEDSEYMPGIDAPEGLSSLSSDNVALSVNLLPLPTKGTQIIKLDVEGARSGIFKLEKTELDSIPQSYEIWLIDKFKKDSLNMRTTSSYSFNINKSDTTSFGKNRFEIVVRLTTAASVQLLNFTAYKVNNFSNISWTTKNEKDSTTFTVERSIDNGSTFFVLDQATSNGTGSYSYIDKTPINGTDQYRVKITDLNSIISYSKIITLSYDQNGIIASKINVYPNPSNGVINLSVLQNSSNNTPANLSVLQTANAIPDLAATYSNTTSYDIKIINITGFVIKTATSTSANWQANLSSLLPGTYIIQVFNNSDKSFVGKNTFIKL